MLARLLRHREAVGRLVKPSGLGTVVVDGRGCVLWRRSDGIEASTSQGVAVRLHCSK
jgi:hypothetical protein